MSQRSTTFAAWTGCVISLCALVFAAYPTIRLALLPERLVMDAHSSIHITDKYGYPNFSLPLSFRNDGGSEIRVKTIHATIRRDGKHIGVYTGNRFLDESGPQSKMFLLTSLRIKAGEEWGRSTFFSNKIDRRTETTLRAAFSEMSQDVNTKRKALKPGKAADEVEADPKLVVPFTESFERNFVWEPGEYAIEIRVTAEPDAASLTREFRFVLFESDTASLRKRVEKYKFGIGIFGDPPDPLFVSISPVESYLATDRP